VSQSSQEIGNGVADVLLGKVSPAGRLVQTWITSIDQLPPILDYNIRNGRTYMYNKNAPLFPFGYGLSYTSFKYSGLKTDKKTLTENETVNVTFSIQNTGNYEGDEVAQLYVGFPDSKVERPVRALKGFIRIFVRKGETKAVTIPLKSSDLSYWDTVSNKWSLEPGKIDMYIGASSTDIKLKGALIAK
jgi:beta-glucosidase